MAKKVLTQPESSNVVSISRSRQTSLPPQEQEAQISPRDAAILQAQADAERLSEELARAEQAKASANAGNQSKRNQRVNDIRQALQRAQLRAQGRFSDAESLAFQQAIQEESEARRERAFEEKKRAAEEMERSQLQQGPRVTTEFIPPKMESVERQRLVSSQPEPSKYEQIAGEDILRGGRFGSGREFVETSSGRFFAKVGENEYVQTTPAGEFLYVAERQDLASEISADLGARYAIQRQGAFFPSLLNIPSAIVGATASGADFKSQLEMGVMSDIKAQRAAAGKTEAELSRTPEGRETLQNLRETGGKAADIISLGILGAGPSAAVKLGKGARLVPGAPEISAERVLKASGPRRTVSSLSRTRLDVPVTTKEVIVTEPGPAPRTEVEVASEAYANPGTKVSSSTRGSFKTVREPKTIEPSSSVQLSGTTSTQTTVKTLKPSLLRPRNARVFTESKSSSRGLVVAESQVTSIQGTKGADELFLTTRSKATSGTVSEAGRGPRIIGRRQSLSNEEQVGISRAPDRAQGRPYRGTVSLNDRQVDFDRAYFIRSGRLTGRFKVDQTRFEGARRTLGGILERRGIRIRDVNFDKPIKNVPGVPEGVDRPDFLGLTVVDAPGPEARAIFIGIESDTEKLSKLASREGFRKGDARSLKDTIRAHESIHALNPRLSEGKVRNLEDLSYNEIINRFARDPGRFRGVGRGRREVTIRAVGRTERGVEGIAVLESPSRFQRFGPSKSPIRPAAPVGGSAGQSTYLASPSVKSPETARMEALGILNRAAAARAGSVVKSSQRSDLTGQIRGIRLRSQRARSLRSRRAQSVGRSSAYASGIAALQSSAVKSASVAGRAVGRSRTPAVFRGLASVQDSGQLSGQKQSQARKAAQLSLLGTATRTSTRTSGRQPIRPARGPRLRALPPAFQIGGRGRRSGDSDLLFGYRVIDKPIPGPVSVIRGKRKGVDISL